MRATIIQPNGDLEQEKWVFSLLTIIRSNLYLDSYSFQTRATKRHKWVTQIYWDRLDKKACDINTPLVSSDVEAEMRSTFQNLISELPIQY